MLAYRTLNLIARRIPPGTAAASNCTGASGKKISPWKQIEYVELAEDLLFPLELPRWRWAGVFLVGINQQEKAGAGGILGRRTRHPGDDRHGQNGFFIISPEQPKLFVRTYRQMIELGSLVPMQAASSFSALLADRKSGVWPIKPRLADRLDGAQFGVVCCAGWLVGAHPFPKSHWALIAQGRSASPGLLRPVCSCCLRSTWCWCSPGMPLSLLFIRQKGAITPSSLCCGAAACLCPHYSSWQHYLSSLPAEFFHNESTVIHRKSTGYPQNYPRYDPFIPNSLVAAFPIFFWFSRLPLGCLGWLGKSAFPQRHAGRRSDRPRSSLGWAAGPWAALLLAFFISSSLLSKTVSLPVNARSAKNLLKVLAAIGGRYLPTAALGAFLVVIHLLFFQKMFGPWLAYAGAMANRQRRHLGYRIGGAQSGAAPA